MKSKERVRALLKAVEEYLDKNGALSETYKDYLIKLFHNPSVAMLLVSRGADFRELRFYGVKERKFLRSLARDLQEAIEASADKGLDNLAVDLKNRLAEYGIRPNPLLKGAISEYEASSLYDSIYFRDITFHSFATSKGHPNLIYIPKIDIKDNEDEKFLTLAELDELEDKAKDVDFIFEALYGFRLPVGEITGLAGATGVGKSTFALNLATSYANEGYRVLYITLELSTTKIREYVKDIVVYHSFDEEIVKQNFLISANANIFSIRNFISQQYEKKNGIDLLVIDYIALLKGLPSNGEKLHEQIAKYTAQVKEISKDFDVASLVIYPLVKQPNKFTFTENDVLGGASTIYTVAGLLLFEFPELEKAKGQKIQQTYNELRRASRKKVRIRAQKDRYHSLPNALELTFDATRHIFIPEKKDEPVEGEGSVSYNPSVSTLIKDDEFDESDEAVDFNKLIEDYGDDDDFNL